MQAQPPIRTNGVDTDRWPDPPAPAVPVGDGSPGIDVTPLLARLLDAVGPTGHKATWQQSPEISAVALVAVAVSSHRIAAELVEIRRLLQEDAK